MAYLPGQSTFEMSITSGKFEADLFVMTNATEFTENAAYAMPITEFLTPDANKQVVLDKTPAEGSIKITWPKATASDTGYMDIIASGTPGEGEALLDTTAGSKSRLTFHAGDIPANTAVEISYEYTVTAQEAKIDNRSSARGEAVMNRRFHHRLCGCSCLQRSCYCAARIRRFLQEREYLPVHAGGYGREAHGQCYLLHRLRGGCLIYN